MIKFNNSDIIDWNFDDSNIIKVYHNGAVCYYKIITSGGTQVPCFAVVDDITQYQEIEFEDVFDKTTEKWYKLNNLNQYEQYGVYGSGRTITTYEGKLTIDEEVTPPPSRLPQGYTEVEYVENTSQAYLNLGVVLYDGDGTTWSISTKFASEPQAPSWDTFAYLLSTENTASPYYGFTMRWQNGYNFNIGGNPDNLVYNLVDNGDGTSGATITCPNATINNNTPLTMFVGTDGNFGQDYWRNGTGKFYALQLTKNNALVRNLVPAKRNSDDKYGMYDLVTDTFYTSPNGYSLSGGSELPSTTATCEFMYSGGSWINVGEVSGSTIQTVWYDPASSGNNAKFDIGHYWGEGYKMVFNMYIQGSYSRDIGTFWLQNNASPIEFNLYSNGFYYDMHDPTSTTSPSVYTGDYSQRILASSVLSNYQNGQIMNVTLTYGTIKFELEDGTVVYSSGSQRSGYNWYDGLYLPTIQNGSTKKASVSSIKVYNANDVLVNDLSFVKNNATGSQELSMYDSVLNVTYNNTNSNTPTYHIVEDSGGTEYPIYYDEIQDPPNNLSFSSITEAEEYECPWVGMKATIAGSAYTFTSGYTWEYVPSRLPVGYTEVEYIENTDYASLELNYKPNQDTRIITTMQATSSNRNVYGRFFGSGRWDCTDGNHGYQFDYEEYPTGKLHISWGAECGWDTSTNVYGDYNVHTYDWNKNEFYIDNTLVDSTTYQNFTCENNLGIFAQIFDNGIPPRINNNENKEYLRGKLYSFQAYDDGTLAIELVPCINPNNVVGAYDIVNNVFYTAVNQGYYFVAGPAVN